jgi:predicted nuclease of predicted toxin-antitoxin system
MRIKLDENLPVRLAGVLASLGHDVDTVSAEGLSGQEDSVVWEAAQTTERFLITQDLDFADMRRFQLGTHDGILVVRLRNPGREALFRKIVTLFENEAVEEWSRCFVVATERKLRLRRP